MKCTAQIQTNNHLKPNSKRSSCWNSTRRCSIPLKKGEPTLHVEFAQTITRVDYIQHYVFYNFVGTPPRVQNIRGGLARDSRCIRFHTYSHPEVKFYYEIFSPAHSDHTTCAQRAKRVTESINELLTARGLAYWFMDDGCSFQIKQKCYLVFSTNSSSLADQQKLVEALRDRFESLMAATIQKHSSYYIFGQNPQSVLWI